MRQPVQVYLTPAERDVLDRRAAEPVAPLEQLLAELEQDRGG